MYDLLEDRRTDEVNNFFVSFFSETNRAHVAMRLFRNRSQIMFKRGKNINDTLN